MREELARVSAALAQSQRETLDQVAASSPAWSAASTERLPSSASRCRGVRPAPGRHYEGSGGGAAHARRAARGTGGTVNAQLAQSQKNLGAQLEGATKVFGELKGQLGQVAEMATRMEALGREIEELQGILKAPKLRGNMGEAQLEEFLRQVLPPSFGDPVQLRRRPDGRRGDQAARPPGAGGRQVPPRVVPASARRRGRRGARALRKEFETVGRGGSTRSPSTSALVRARSSSPSCTSLRRRSTTR